MKNVLVFLTGVKIEIMKSIKIAEYKGIGEEQCGFDDFRKQNQKKIFTLAETKKLDSKEEDVEF